MFGTTEVMPGQYPVKRLGYHKGVHFDEVVTDLALRRNTGKFYPGIKTAEAVFIDRETLGKVDAFANLKAGLLVIGAGDSPYNEHETPSRGEVAGHCAATLAAGLHGFLEDKNWKRLLEETRRMDRTPQEFEGNVPGHVANIMKVMVEMGAEDHEVFNWATKAAEAMQIKAENFFDGAMQEFEKVAQTQHLHLYTNQPVRLAIIRADEQVFTSVAFRKKFDAALALKSDGTIFFGTRKGGPIPLATVGEMFRRLAVWNLRACKQAVPRAYEEPGAKLPDDVGPLHLWREAIGILNKDVALKLTQRQVISIVQDSLLWDPRPAKRHNERKDRPQREERKVIEKVKSAAAGFSNTPAIVESEPEVAAADAAPVQTDAPATVAEPAQLESAPAPETVPVA